MINMASSQPASRPDMMMMMVIQKLGYSQTIIDMTDCIPSKHRCQSVLCMLVIGPIMEMFLLNRRLLRGIEAIIIGPAIGHVMDFGHKHAIQLNLKDAWSDFLEWKFLFK